MARLKVYSFNAHHVQDDRITNILAEPRSRPQYDFYVVASSKQAAVDYVKAKSGNFPRLSELRLAGGNTYDALLEAALFDNEGTVLVTTERGGKKPVVLADRESESDEVGTGSQAIGTLRPADGRQGQVFEATMAKYAGRGSIAVGATVAYVKVYEDGWEGTKGDAPGDDAIQLLIDMGELDIIRSGFGDRWMPGR